MWWHFGQMNLLHHYHRGLISNLDSGMRGTEDCFSFDLLKQGFASCFLEVGVFRLISQINSQRYLSPWENEKADMRNWFLALLFSFVFVFLSVPSKHPWAMQLWLTPERHPTLSLCCSSLTASMPGILMWWSSQGECIHWLCISWL